jgi:uncharacterized protein YdeI (BOF family)
MRRTVIVLCLALPFASTAFAGDSGSGGFDGRAAPRASGGGGYDGPGTPGGGGFDAQIAATTIDVSTLRDNTEVKSSDGASSDQASARDKPAL